MRKIVVWVLIFALVLSLIAMVASAESVSDTWVYDESDYISELTEKHIEEINTNRQRTNQHNNLAVVLLDEVDRNDMKNRASSLFTKYGLDYGDDSYDVLVLLSIKNKVYHIEYAKGYETNNSIYRDLTSRMIGEDVTALLDVEKYDQAIISVGDYFNEMMCNLQSGEYGRREAVSSKASAIYKIVLATILASVMTISIILFAMNERKRAIDKDDESCVGKTQSE